MIIIEWILNTVLFIFLLSIPVGVVLNGIELIIAIKCNDLLIQYRFFWRKLLGNEGMQQ